MMEKDSLVLNPDDWDYLHEGNQHLILRHVGSNEQFIGKVLRLNKANEKKNGSAKKSSSLFEKFLDEKTLLDKLESDIFETHEVIKHYHSKQVLKVENEEEFLKAIIAKIEEKRPENRRGKHIDVKTSIEMLLDYTFSFRNVKLDIEGYSQMTVEIKPKSFLFDEISEEELATILETKKNFSDKEAISAHFKKYFSREAYQSSSEKVKFTKFHKVQLKKNTDHSVKKFSKYDPHDLFSCVEENVKKAIDDLYQTPQNNLRVFIDSHALSETEINDLESVLQKYFKDEMIKTKFAELITKALLASKLLETIRDFQNLNPGTGLRLRKVLKKLEPLEGTSSKDQLYESLVNLVNRSLGKEHKFENDESPENLIGEIVKFLLSIAFRDCSMLISFHFAKKNSSDQIKNFFLNNGFTLLETDHFSEDVYFKTGFIDFQMKSFEHLNKYIDNFEDLICMYWNSLE